MPLFETTVPINEEQVKKIVLEKWGIKIESLLKASQNHTFQGIIQLSTNENKNKYEKCSVRVTPDPEQKSLSRIKDELFFVKYCADRKLRHCCAPIPTKQTQELYVKDGDLIIAAFEWAKGEPINFFDLKWMSDVPLIHAWGRYFAQLHQISKKFSQQYPQVANRIQNWNEIHHGVLKKIELVEQDKKDVSNVKYYGVLHGDLNTSNSYYHQEQDYFSVYDTDQTQRGFYEWDLAQAIFGTVLLKQAGMPISGDKVPQANRQFFESKLIQGYEKVAGQGSINRVRLARMVDMKKQFYRLFCTQAIQEGNIPKQMQPFIRYIAKAFDQNYKQQQEQKQPNNESKQEKQQQK